VVALHHRDFRFFYVALLVAGIGSQIQAFANILQIYDLTGSALQLGLTGLARAVPTIAFSLMGGIIADRVDRLRFSMVAQAINGMLSVALALLTWAGMIDVWHIYVFTFLGGAVAAINTPARSAIIPNLVPRNHLLNAIALNSTVWQSSNILGPTIAGLSIGVFGFAPTYLINGIAQIVAISALGMIRVGRVTAHARQSPARELVEGLKFVRRRSIIWVLLAADMTETFFGRYQAILPIVAVSLGAGAAGTGVLAAAPGVGNLTGAALIMAMGNFRYKGLVVISGILCYCGALVLLAAAPWAALGTPFLLDPAVKERIPTSVSPWFALAMTATFLLGVFDSIQATPRSGVIQLVTPDEFRGRVSSFQSMLTGGIPPLGQALNGAIASVIGVPLALILGASTCVVAVTSLTMARPELRAADIGADESAAPVPTPAAATT
jgi:MFS family permease